MEKLKLVQCSIRKWEDCLHGVQFFESSNIIGIIINPTDYILDGITFINKKRVKKTSLNNDELSERIMKVKAESVLNSIPIINSDFQDFKQVFQVLKNADLFCELALSKEDVVYVGEIIKVNDDSLDIDFYSTKFELMDNAYVKFKDITSVTVFSDYSLTFQNVVRNIW